MNYYLLKEIFNSTILITAVIGVVRFRHISSDFFPFLLLTWIGAFNDITSLILVRNGMYNIYNFNAYQFIESLLIIWQFRRWQLFERDGPARIAYGLMTGVYLIDVCMLTGLHGFNSYFRIFYATVVVLLSVQMINKLLITERGNLLRQPAFLICCGFLLFFTFAILTEVFWLYGAYLNEGFRASLNSIVVWTNLFCNLTFALAVLWMPSRQAFSLPY